MAVGDKRNRDNKLAAIILSKLYMLCIALCLIVPIVIMNQDLKTILGCSFQHLMNVYIHIYLGVCTIAL